MGFTKLPQSLRVLVSSYLTFSPLPCEVAAKPPSQGGMFSVALSFSPVKWRRCPFHGGQSVLRTTLPCGARTFLPSPISRSVRYQEERPSVPLRIPSFPEISENLKKSLQSFWESLPAASRCAIKRAYRSFFGLSFFFLCNPLLDCLIRQTVCLFVLFPWDGFNLKR